MPITVPAQNGLGQWTDRIDISLPRFVAGQTTTAAFTTGSVYLVRFRLDQPLRISKMSIYCGPTVVASSIDLGIYTGTVGGTTYTRIASTGPSTPGTSAETEIALTAAVSLAAGVDYWGAMGCNDGTDTILRLGAAVASGGASLVKAAAWSSGLPATISTPVANGTIPFLSIAV